MAYEEMLSDAMAKYQTILERKIEINPFDAASRLFEIYRFSDTRKLKLSSSSRKEIRKVETLFLNSCELEYYPLIDFMLVKFSSLLEFHSYMERLITLNNVSLIQYILNKVSDSVIVDKIEKSSCMGLLIYSLYCVAKESGDNEALLLLLKHGVIEITHILAEDPSFTKFSFFPNIWELAVECVPDDWVSTKFRKLSKFEKYMAIIDKNCTVDILTIITQQLGWIFHTDHQFSEITVLLRKTIQSKRTSEEGIDFLLEKYFFTDDSLTEFHPYAKQPLIEILKENYKTHIRKDSLGSLGSLPISNGLIRAVLLLRGYVMKPKSGYQSSHEIICEHFFGTKPVPLVEAATLSTLKLLFSAIGRPSVNKKNLYCDSTPKNIFALEYFIQNKILTFDEILKKSYLIPRLLESPIIMEEIIKEGNLSKLLKQVSKSNIDVSLNIGEHLVPIRIVKRHDTFFVFYQDDIPGLSRINEYTHTLDSKFLDIYQALNELMVRPVKSARK